MNHAAGDGAARVGERLGRVERKRAVGAEDVRRAHAAQLVRRLSGRRIVRGHAQDRRPHARRFEPRPERLAARAAASRVRPSAETATARPASSTPPLPFSSSTDTAPSSPGSRWMKSKMPWPAGSRPVVNDDHATGLCGGIDVPSGENAAHLREPREVRQAAGLHQRARELDSRAHRTRARSRAAPSSRSPARRGRTPRVSDDTRDEDGQRSKCASFRPLSRASEE